MFRHLLFAALLVTVSGAIARDADVLRLNYRKTPAAKPVAKPPATLPKSTDALHKTSASTALLTASTKLEPR